MNISKLSINLSDLQHQQTIEGERIEYKAWWNPDLFIRTICAFANDFENLGGSYVVIGQDYDASSQPMFPPVGPVETTLLAKPNSSNQRYRLTTLGQCRLEKSRGNDVN